MKTIAVNNADGCYKETDAETLKFRLLPGRGLSGEELKRLAMGVLKDKKESMQNRIFAIQSLARVKFLDAEDLLIQIVQKKDIQLSFPALKTLAFTGTARAFQALSGMASLPLKSLARQKDFTMLIIGYRLQLPGTDKVLENMLKDAYSGKRVEEYPLRFQTMGADDIPVILKQSLEADNAVPLSRRTGIQVDVGGQQFYFVFSSKLENNADWKAALYTKQIAGHLFRKELHTSFITQQYIVLATPVRDIIQLSFFNKSGKLFMLANVSYNMKKNSFIISNVEENPKKVQKAEFRLNDDSILTLNLSFIRQEKKRKSVVIA